jgi:nucleoside-diphosphate-sugar epimerase
MRDWHLVTGGTGLLGSHIAEQLVAGGERVRALVRAKSNTDFLRSIGVECVIGDLHDLDSLDRAMKDVRVAYHAAAKVGDWGTKTEFEGDTVEGTRNVAQASLRAGVERLIHVSSTSAYGHPAPSDVPIVETSPLGERFWIWDEYTRAKVNAERLLRKMQERDKLPITIIRPGWLYGPRDRLTIKRIRDSLQHGRVRIIGPGTNRMNTVYAGTVAHCCLLAAKHASAVGQAYNVTNDGVVTQSGWFDLWAKELNVPRPTKHISYRAAFAGGFCLEAIYRLIKSKEPPYITRYAVWLLGRPSVYSTAKAERELGWKPDVTYQEGVHRAVEWFQSAQL